MISDSTFDFTFDLFYFLFYFILYSSSLVLHRVYPWPNGHWAYLDLSLCTRLKHIEAWIEGMD